MWRETGLQEQQLRVPDSSVVGGRGQELKLLDPSPVGDQETGM